MGTVANMAQVCMCGRSSEVLCYRCANLGVWEGSGLRMGTQVRALKGAKGAYIAQVCTWGGHRLQDERSASECMSDQGLGWGGARAGRVEGEELHWGVQGAGEGPGAQEGMRSCQLW